MTLVIDASAVVALLVDGGKTGEWVRAAIAEHDLIAPALMEFEVANILRRHELAGLIDATTAALAHRDLLDLAVEPWPYEPLAARVWQLRHNVTAYDGAYVALAELVEATLVTLDSRLASSPGPTCSIVCFSR
jgi:predicted nucleic acid-binding protein